MVITMPVPVDSNDRGAFGAFVFRGFGGAGWSDQVGACDVISRSSNLTRFPAA
jgi:hypothetical protein